MQDRERDSDDNRFIHHTLVCIESASSGKKAYAGIRHLPPDGNQIESVKTEDWNDNDKEIILTYAEHKQMDMVYPCIHERLNALQSICMDQSFISIYSWVHFEGRLPVRSLRPRNALLLLKSKKRREIRPNSI